MATIHFTTTTTATPEQFTAGVTDFGPGRSALFGNTDDSQLKVHDQGPDWADVTEGKGPAWERLRYDWSEPNPYPDDHDRLEHLGRSVRAHLHARTSGRQHDRHRRRRRARG